MRYMSILKMRTKTSTGVESIKSANKAFAAERKKPRPDTVNRTIKLRLLVRPPVPVSTAINRRASVVYTEGNEEAQCATGSIANHK